MIQIGVNVGYVNQWKARLKVYVVWTQMKFLMIILKVISSFIISFTTEAATRGVLHKKLMFKMLQNSQENTCARVYFIKNETLAQVFSCEFCSIFKNTTGRLLLLLQYQIYCYQMGSGIPKLKNRLMCYDVIKPS